MEIRMISLMPKIMLFDCQNKLKKDYQWFLWTKKTPMTKIKSLNRLFSKIFLILPRAAREEKEKKLEFYLVLNNKDKVSKKLKSLKKVPIRKNQKNIKLDKRVVFKINLAKSIISRRFQLHSHQPRSTSPNVLFSKKAV